MPILLIRKSSDLQFLEMSTNKAIIRVIEMMLINLEAPFMQIQKPKLRIRHQISIKCAAQVFTIVKHTKCSSLKTMGFRLWCRRQAPFDRAEVRTQQANERIATASRVRKQNLLILIKVRLLVKNTIKQNNADK